jgi:hypothetical protein
MAENLFARAFISLVHSCVMLLVPNVNHSTSVAKHIAHVLLVNSFKQTHPSDSLD